MSWRGHESEGIFQTKDKVEEKDWENACFRALKLVNEGNDDKQIA